MGFIRDVYNPIRAPYRSSAAPYGFRMDPIWDSYGTRTTLYGRSTGPVRPHMHSVWIPYGIHTGRVQPNTRPYGSRAAPYGFRMDPIWDSYGTCATPYWRRTALCVRYGIQLGSVRPHIGVARALYGPVRVSYESFIGFIRDLYVTVVVPCVISLNFKK